MASTVPYALGVSLVVAFDLDMTLLDTAAGIAATYRALSAQTGVHVDADLAASRLGPKLAVEIANWFPPAEVDRAVTMFRSLYPRHAVEPSRPMPGATEAVAATRAAGGLVAVVTAKLGTLARLHLDHVGLAVDAVVGDAFAEGKTGALRELGATAYVGDHVADVRAAVAAGPGVAAVGVPTGPCTAEELAAAGADVVLDDLTEFPAWLAGLAAVVPSRSAAGR